jgi:hypothetical protein
MTILAPSATNTSAVRRPMPLVAPVMTATLPLSRPISFSWFLSDVEQNYIPGLREQRKRRPRRRNRFARRLLPCSGFDDRLIVL